MGNDQGRHRDRHKRPHGFDSLHGEYFSSFIPEVIGRGSVWVLLPGATPKSISAAFVRETSGEIRASGIGAPPETYSRPHAHRGVAICKKLAFFRAKWTADQSLGQIGFAVRCGSSSRRLSGGWRQ